MNKIIWCVIVPPSKHAQQRAYSAAQWGLSKVVQQNVTSWSRCRWAMLRQSGHLHKKPKWQLHDFLVSDLTAEQSERGLLSIQSLCYSGAAQLPTGKLSIVTGSSWVCGKVTRQAALEYFCSLSTFCFETSNILLMTVHGHHYASKNDPIFITRGIQMWDYSRFA